MSDIAVHHGDSREVLKTLADGSVDSCVCDPPYALVSITKRFGKEGSAACKPGKTGAYARASAGFMGQRWDTGETAFDPAFWAEVLRVLKPGAHLLAFSGTRTYHRMACAIEDAGFEIRDQIGWAFGSGFPKSHNQKGDWEGWGTALKPAWEPVCVARKPLDGTVASNVQRHGTGALHIAACRVEGEINSGWSKSGSKASENVAMSGANYARDAKPDNAEGRWPANLIHDGSDEVVACFPNTAPARSGVPRSGSNGDGWGMTSTGAEYDDNGGSAARFFYTAKADAEDRLGSKHPTVKPVDLMAYLCRLVTPPGGTVLDPFAGTGTTGLAAMREGFDCILIEREAQYVADIERRLAWARGKGRLTAQETARHKPAEGHGPLFGSNAA